MNYILKNTDGIPPQMKPTTRSMVLESSVCFSGLIVFLIFVFDPDHSNIELLYPFSSIFILSSFIGAYYEMDWNAFKLSMKSFRGCCILISMILNVIIDVSRKFICNNSNPLLTIIILDVVWISSVIMMISADSVPRITNYIRLFGPLCVLIANIWSMIKMNFWPTCNYIILRISHGSLTSLDVEMACKLNILFYGCTFLWAVPRDAKHEYFVLVDKKIKIKTLLPFRDVDVTSNLKTNWLFHIISICGSLFALLFMICVTLFDPRDDNVPLPFLIINAILVAITYTLCFILIYRHFQSFMIKELILQFRANILIATILLMLYELIQLLIWHKIGNSLLLSFIIQTTLNKLAFIMVCILQLLRDGMNISYPNYFVILFGVVLFAVALFDMYALEFGNLSTIYPKWFALVEKQTYNQVVVISYLSLYYIYMDNSNTYFALIRKRKKTAEIWDDNHAIDIQLKEIDDKFNEPLLDFDVDEQL